MTVGSVASCRAISLRSGVSERELIGKMIGDLMEIANDTVKIFELSVASQAEPVCKYCQEARSIDCPVQDRVKLIRLAPLSETIPQDQIKGQIEKLKRAFHRFEKTMDVVFQNSEKLHSAQEQRLKVLELENRRLKKNVQKYGDKINAISRREKEVRVEYQLVAIPTFCLYNFNFR